MHMPPLASTDDLLRQYVEDEYGAQEGGVVLPFPTGLTADAWCRLAQDQQQRLAQQDDLLETLQAAVNELHAKNDGLSLTIKEDRKEHADRQSVLVSAIVLLAIAGPLLGYLVGSFAR